MEAATSSALFCVSCILAAVFLDRLSGSFPGMVSESGSSFFIVATDCVATGSVTTGSETTGCGLLSSAVVALTTEGFDTLIRLATRCGFSSVAIICSDFSAVIAVCSNGLSLLGSAAVDNDFFVRFSSCVITEAEPTRFDESGIRFTFFTSTSCCGAIRTSSNSSEEASATGIGDSICVSKATPEILRFLRGVASSTSAASCCLFLSARILASLSSRDSFGSV